MGTAGERMRWTFPIQVEVVLPTGGGRGGPSGSGLMGHLACIQKYYQAKRYCLIIFSSCSYGDVVPSSVLGKIVGSVCCVSGVVLLALPIPILQEKQVPCTLASVTSRKRRRPEKTINECSSCLEENRCSLAQIVTNGNVNGESSKLMGNHT